MKYKKLLLLALSVGTALCNSAVRADDAAAIDRGRYLVSISGCNDCHTAGYGEKAGKVPESEWLLGTPVGFQGPWGTTYAANLRIVAERYTAEQFIARSRSELLPPMPWFNLVNMSDADLRAIYAFIRSLGPVGEPVPAYLPPGVAPKTSFLVFVPQTAAADAVAQQ
jgi:mono/diheme cytochrome c family protein